MFSICKKIFFKLKRNFFVLIFLYLCICLILFSKYNIPAIKSGLNLWANSVIPSLFPFFIATELLLNTNFIQLAESLFNKIMIKIFNVNGSGAFALIMGFLSGYPVGAKIASDFRRDNICSKEECERLLSFTNNSGPLFILGTIGTGMYKNSCIGYLLLITHILSSLTVGYIFSFWKKNKASNSTQKIYKTRIDNLTISNLGDILQKSITNSISTILLIGGFIVLFSSIISILNCSGIFSICTKLLNPLFLKLNIPSNFITGFLIGLLEITNGINIIANIAYKKISTNIILSSFLLGFGGFSIMLQVLSITSKTDLSFRSYILGKILHGLIASLYTYLLIKFFPIFNFNL